MIYFLLKKQLKTKLFIKNNITLVKQVGRINNILEIKETNDKIQLLKILSLNEKVLLKFSENIDLVSQKHKYFAKN